MQTPTRPVDNPCGYPVDWGLALHTMPIQYRYYTIDHGQWTRFDDRVEVSIHVAVAQLPGQSPLNAGWDVEMTFDNGSSAADWFNVVHGFKADCGSIDANANEWEYFILQAGATMTGWGAFEGSALSLEHAPINEYFGYQLGTGANNYNGDEDGFGGWFGYSGAFRASANADFINVYGAGDVCCTLNCCPQYEVHRQWTATDCSGNSAVCEQVISWSDSVNTVAISECSVLLDGAGTISYNYDFNTGSVQPIDLNGSFNSTDIAHYWDAENQIGNIWLYNNLLDVIRQWQITSLNPLIIDSDFVDFAFPEGLTFLGNGLGCISPTKLIATTGGTQGTIIEIDLSTNPFTFIPILSLPPFSAITGDILVTTDNKILYSLTQLPLPARKLICQNDYPIPGNEIVIDYSAFNSLPPTSGVLGLFQNEGEIFLAFGNGKIYNIDQEFPYAMQLTDSLGFLVDGASQTPQCLNVSLIPHDNEGVQGEETSYFRGGISVLPNPAIHHTQFAFRAGETASARIELFDFTGKRVAEVFSGAVEEGKQYNIDFNVNSLATGFYTYRFTNGEQIVVERLIIAK
jgi:hypothetical protein